MYLYVCTKYTFVCICKEAGWDLGLTAFFFNIFDLSKKKSKRCERKPPIISNLKYKIWAHRPTGGASDIVKAESSGEDPRATGGLVSNLLHPRVNKTKQHTPSIKGTKPLFTVIKAIITIVPFLLKVGSYVLEVGEPTQQRSLFTTWD